VIEQEHQRPTTGRRCVHRWGPAQKVGRARSRWMCQDCREIRKTGDRRPQPGTLAEAIESWAAEVHVIGARIAQLWRRAIRR
jgi:hypothetical protein